MAWQRLCQDVQSIQSLKIPKGSNTTLLICSQAQLATYKLPRSLVETKKVVQKHYY